VNSIFIKLREAALHCTHGTINCPSCIERGEKVQLAVDALEAADAREKRVEAQRAAENEEIRAVAQQIVRRPLFEQSPVRNMRVVHEQVQWMERRIKELEAELKAKTEG